MITAQIGNVTENNTDNATGNGTIGTENKAKERNGMKKRVIACVCAAVMSMGMAMTMTASATTESDCRSIINYVMEHSGNWTKENEAEFRDLQDQYIKDNFANIREHMAEAINGGGAANFYTNDGKFGQYNTNPPASSASVAGDPVGFEECTN